MFFFVVVVVCECVVLFNLYTYISFLFHVPWSDFLYSYSSGPLLSVVLLVLCIV